MSNLALPELLETNRLKLQRLRYEDADEIFYTYASKPDATRYVSFPTHQSIEDTRSYLRYAIPAWNKGIDFTYAIRLKESNRLIGTCGIINDQGKIQYGYVFGPIHWGKGYASEVGITIINILKQIPVIHRVGSFVDAENVASIRVLEKIGMKHEATLTRWFRFVNQGNEPKDCLLFKL